MDSALSNFPQDHVKTPPQVKLSGSSSVPFMTCWSSGKEITLEFYNLTRISKPSGYYFFKVMHNAFDVEENNNEGLLSTGHTLSMYYHTYS